MLEAVGLSEPQPAAALSSSGVWRLSVKPAGYVVVLDVGILSHVNIQIV